MIRRKKTFLILWGIAFALTLFLVLIVPAQITGITIAALFFDCVAFISQLLLWLKLSSGEQSANGIIRNTPTALVTITYLIVSIVLSVLCGAFPNLFSIKTTVIVNVINMAVAWLLLIALWEAKGHIERVDSRQINHHIEWRGE